jgi:flavorubredoxin
MFTTDVDEVADGIYRLSTWIEPAGLRFNQFLLDAEQPLLFHTGQRNLFPFVKDAVATVLPPESVRWIAFGHLESDESGAMNEWLGVAPEAQVVAGHLANVVSLNDLADRPPVGVDDGEVVDLGGKRVRHIDTPHVPHGWDARVLYEEVTGTLLCGDLFTQTGDGPASTDADIVGPAIEAEDLFHATCLAPSTGDRIRGLADLGSTTLALMHGPAYTGDNAEALRGLAADYDRRVAGGPSPA